MKKQKKCFTKIISLLLAFVLITIPITTIAVGNDESAEGVDISRPIVSKPGSGTPSVPTGPVEPDPQRFDYTWQGWRIYVAIAYYDSNNNYVPELSKIVKTKNGTDCIDFINLGLMLEMASNPKTYYNTSQSTINTGDVLSCKVRAQDLENGSTKTYMNDLRALVGMQEGFEEENLDKNVGLDVAVDGRTLKGSNVKTFLNKLSYDYYTKRNGATERLDMKKRIVLEYYNLDFAEAVIEEEDYAPEVIPGMQMTYIMFVENTFMLPVKCGEVFYGTPFEYGVAVSERGLDYDVTNASHNYSTTLGLLCSAIFCSRNQLGADFFPNVGLIEAAGDSYRDPYKDVMNTNINSPRSDGKFNASKELQFHRLGNPDYDYGVNMFRITGQNNPVPEEVKDPDYDYSNPTAPLVIKNVGSDAAIMTGWESSEGMYDICYSESSGIPASEYLVNNIVAQDSLINVIYGTQSMSPHKYPEVNYEFEYYNEHPLGTHREHPYDSYTDYSDPNYDEYGNVIGYPTKTKPCEHYLTCKQADCRTSSIVHVQTIPRIAVYYYIQDYAVHGLSGVTVESAAIANHGISDPLTEDEITINVSGVEKPTEIKDTNASYHVNWDNVQKSITVKNGDVGQGVFDNFREAQKWAQINAATDANNRIGYPKVKNDLFIVDGVEYLNNTEVTGKENTNASFVTIPQAPNITLSYKAVQESQKVQIPYNTYNGRYYTTLTGFYDKLCGTITYPETYLFEWTSSDHDHAYIMQNGNAVADRIHAMRGNNSIRETTTLKNGVTRTFVKNDPMMVITPVIANSTLHTPTLSDTDRVSMTEKEIQDWEDLNGHQMSENRITSAQQVRLDEPYTITFDPYLFYQWVVGGSNALYDSFSEEALGYNKSDDTSDNDNEWHGRDNFETDSKYDKYVLQKWLKFPFDVYIDDILFNADTWICIYDYDPESNTTTAGDTKENHLKSLTFYIPPWAKETVGNIETLVYATNEEGINFSENDALGRIQVIHGSLDGSEVYTYAAYQAINVQSSGWAYDFRVVGVNDVNYEEDNEEVTLFGERVSLANIWDEFFSGIFNRTGKDNDANDNTQRRLKDYILAKLQTTKANRTKTVYTANKDTLPIDSTSNDKNVIGGALSLGSDFSFTFKTMANLTTDDKIIVEPTYTYYPMEYFESYDETTGTYDESLKVENDDLLIYYHDGSEKYIKAGSVRDTYIETELADEEFKGAVAKEDLIYTADLLGSTAIDFANQTHKVANMKYIEIEGNELMLYDTAALNQIERNQGLEQNHLDDILGNNYGKGPGVNVTEKTTALKQSVQTWYGRYWIPSNMKITTKQKMEEIQIENPETGNIATPTDPADYATYVGGLTGKEDFWITEGFLVLNFKITCYKANGTTYQKWLLYGDGLSDAWTLQKQKEKINIWADYASINKWHNSTTVYNKDTMLEYGMYQIDTQPGDIAVINLAVDNNSGLYNELVFTN